MLSRVSGISMNSLSLNSDNTVSMKGSSTRDVVSGLSDRGLDIITFIQSTYEQTTPVNKDYLELVCQSLVDAEWKTINWSTTGKAKETGFKFVQHVSKVMMSIGSSSYSFLNPFMKDLLRIIYQEESNS